MVYDTNDVSFTGLANGEHTLVAWLVDNNHTALDPVVEETITFSTFDGTVACGESFSTCYDSDTTGAYTDADPLALFSATVDTTGDVISVTFSGGTESNYDYVIVTNGAGVQIGDPLDGDLNGVVVTSDDGTINVGLNADSSWSCVSGQSGFTSLGATVTCVTPAGDPNTVLADPTLGWLGYMNVFDLTAGAQGGFLWGSGWGVPDVATTLNTDTDYMIITLEPNYNAYADNPGDAYWQDGSVGAKWMEGSTYVESASDWNNADLTFTGYVYHHSLATDWTANFFIKALDPNAGYTDALNGAYVTALPTDGVFSVTVPAGELSAGFIVQAGFAVNGPNANPDNQAANGKVILGGDVDAPMSIDDVNVLDMRIYPNPVDGNYVTILSPINGTKYIQVFDINGRRVMDTSINNNTLDVSSINSGFYMIKVTIDGQSKISKLVVR
jgi:hypothetical protein